MIHSDPSFGSFPSGPFLYLNLSFSLVGFTSFHRFRFQKRFVTVAPSDYSQHILANLADFIAVSLLAALTYEFVRHNHSKHLSLGEPGLSSALPCSDYP
jgi:hypothetical protein